MRLSKSQQICFWLILVVGLFVRLWMLSAQHEQLMNVQYDDKIYLTSARVLDVHHIFTYSSPHLPTVFIPPGYPIYLAVVLKLFGMGKTGMYAALIGTALLGTATLGLIVRLGQRLGQPNAGLFSAAVFSLYPPAILSSVLYLTETMFTFWVVSVFLLLLRAIESRRLRDFFLAGLVLGLATLTRPTIALLPVVVGLYLWGRADFRFQKAFRAGITMTAALLLVLSPWMVRNYVDFHRFIPLTKASGNPFLTGTYYNNNVYAFGTDPQFPDWPKGWKRIPADELATNDMLMQIGKERLKQEFQTNPKATIKWYTLGKLRTFWANPFDWNRILKPYWNTIVIAHRTLIALSFLGFLFALWRRLPYTWLFVLWFAYFTVLHMVYTTLPRYAFPLLPFAFYYCGVLLTGARSRVPTYEPEPVYSK